MTLGCRNRDELGYSRDSADRQRSPVIGDIRPHETPTVA